MENKWVLGVCIFKYIRKVLSVLNPLHSERPKLHRVWVLLSANRVNSWPFIEYEAHKVYGNILLFHLFFFTKENSLTLPICSPG